MSDTTDDMEMHHGMMEAHIEAREEAKEWADNKRKEMKRRGIQHLPRALLGTAEYIMATFVFRELRHLNPYFYHISNYGSVYIKFEEEAIGSLRIANHATKKRYTYKWNLFTDGTATQVVESEYKQFYYNHLDCWHFVRHVTNYAKVIERNK